MVSPQARREAVAYLMKTSWQLSLRRACGLVKLSTSVFRYRKKEKSNVLLSQRIRDIAYQRRRFGYRRIHALLKQEGHYVNIKRVYRIYRLADLSVKRRRRKRVILTERTPLIATRHPNVCWSMDFVHDSLANGRRIRCLNIVDDFTRESIAIEVDTSLSGLRVARVLDEVGGKRPLPRMIRVDHGSEFASLVMNDWAHKNNVRLSFIEPGKPSQNAYVESFNGRFRDECLNDHWFTSLDEAKILIERWRKDYNDVRPHSSLGYIPPTEFARNYFLNNKGSTCMCG